MSIELKDQCTACDHEWRDLLMQQQERKDAGKQRFHRKDQRCAGCAGIFLGSRLQQERQTSRDSDQIQRAEHGLYPYRGRRGIKEQCAKCRDDPSRHHLQRIDHQDIFALCPPNPEQ